MDTGTPDARLTFAFVIDSRGHVTSLEAPAALQQLGWTDELVGRKCQIVLACRDLQGRSLCSPCLALSAGPALGGHARPMGVIAAPTRGGDVVVVTSAARRLPRRRVRVVGEV